MSLSVSAGSPICHQMTSDWRDWAALDDGPAGLIADRLLAYDVADYVRFRSMCRTWRRCCADPGTHRGMDRRFHPRQWVMLQERFATPNSRCFFNSSTGKCIQVDIPELCDHYVLAHTPEGLLVLLQQQQQPKLVNVRLLNPLTRHLIELPPLTTLLPRQEQLALSHDNIHYLRAWGSGVADDDSSVVLCFYWLSLLGVAKPGDECWTLVRFDNRLRTSPVMFAGRFYYFSVDGLMVLETSPLRIQEAARRHMVVSTRSTESSHLVDNAGELMLVHRMLVTEGGETRWRYDTYRVDLGTRTLAPINSFGEGRALFLGMDCSLSVPVGVFPSGSISSDTIYFRFGVEERDSTAAYHLADRSIDPAQFNLDGSVPQPHTLVDCLSLPEHVLTSSDAWPVALYDRYGHA